MLPQQVENTIQRKKMKKKIFILNHGDGDVEMLQLFEGRK